ncbi:MAG: HXXEE domain-containing protein [Terrimicrobiaceae bacterium]
MIQRLITYWVYGGTLAGVLLLVLAPLLVGSWPPALIATFLLLPIYMLHQLEEHDDDRFRKFVNSTLGKGRDVLSPLAVFIINVPGVWGVTALSIYLAREVHPGFALIAVYLVLVNAFVHVVNAAISRRYNPGLWTAIFLFVPFGTWTLWLLHQAGADSMPYQVAGFLTAVAIHAAIIIHVRRRDAYLKKHSS